MSDCEENSVLQGSSTSSSVMYNSKINFIVYFYFYYNNPLPYKAQ